jgi:hypothetical protein
MQQNTVTLIVAALGIFGTLAGVVVGQVLSRSWQREQARLDIKRQEYRELMTAMADAYTQLLRAGSGVSVSGEARAEIEAARYNSLRTMHDRIYIAGRVRELDLPQSWAAEMNRYWSSLHRIGAGRFTEGFLTLQDRVRDLAIEDTEPRGFLGRLFGRFRSGRRKHGKVPGVRGDAS